MIEELQAWSPFAVSMVAFLASHAIPARPPIRRRLVGLFGERGYLALYSGLSLILLGWVFHSAGEAPYVQLWPTLDWQYTVPRILIPPAFALGTVGLAGPNPLSFSIVRRAADAKGSAILCVTRHPVPWALCLWATAHLVPNGDLAHVILFGCLLSLAFGGMALLDRRAKRQLGSEAWAELAAASPLVPFSKPIWLRHFTRRDALIASVGLLLAFMMALLHGALIGVPAI